MPDRQQEANSWLHQHFAEITAITTLPGDASFRRYSRVHTPHKNYMFMDAPPALEDCHNFVALTHAYRHHGVHTPAIYAEDLQQGFLLLEDFGDTLLSQILTSQNASDYYRRCYQLLPHIQNCMHIDHQALPAFDDKFIMTELKNFYDWCVLKFSELQLTSKEEQLLNELFQLLIQNAAEQPQVGVHRDYHSRNLMVLDSGQIGVIDFQDAVIGPLTYDLVSLLRDCYVSWPNEEVLAWVKDYYQHFANSTAYSLEQFQRWFDLMGMQRHLKAIFIFCRKYLRDGSSNYLEDIKRGLHYVHLINQTYPELKVFGEFVEHRLSEPLLKRIDHLLNAA